MIQTSSDGTAWRIAFNKNTPTPAQSYSIVLNANCAEGSSCTAENALTDITHPGFFVKPVSTYAGTPSSPDWLPLYYNTGGEIAAFDS
jgi:hypothetical protein